MNFRAIQVMSQAVSTLMDEITWDTYRTPGIAYPSRNRRKRLP